MATPTGIRPRFGVDHEDDSGADDLSGDGGGDILVVVDSCARPELASFAV